MRRALILSTLAALVGVSAIGAAGNPVVNAARRTATAKSAVMQIQATTKIPGSPTIVMSGDGVTKGRSVKIRLRMQGSGQTFTMDLVGLLEGRSFVMYMRSPIFDGQLPPGKSWLRIDMQKQGASMGIDFSSLMSSSQALAPLEHGLVSISRVGSDTIAGKPATHYRAIIDIHRGAAAVPAYRKQVAAIEQLLGMRLGRQTQHVWVGRDGRIRRFRFSMPTGKRGALGTAVQTMTYLAYDVPVSITAPPKALVFSVG